MKSFLLQKPFRIIQIQDVSICFKFLEQLQLRFEKHTAFESNTLFPQKLKSPFLNTFCGNGSERTGFWIFFEGVVLQWQNGRHSNKPDLTSWVHRLIICKFALWWRQSWWKYRWKFCCFRNKTFLRRLMQLCVNSQILRGDIFWSALFKKSRSRLYILNFFNPI